MEAKSLTPCINVMNAKMPHVINSNEVKASVTLDFCNSCHHFAN
jgi:hypothetical protein